MKARYENDPIRGPGYGLVQVEDAEAVAGLAASTDVRFAVIRSGDHKTLHPASWEDTECRLIPDGVTVRGSGLCLAVGPNVVRQLDELNTYRFVLFPPGGAELKAPLALSGVIYPPEDGRNRVGAPVQAAPAPVPAPAPAPVAEPAPELSPPPVRAKKPFPVLQLLLGLVLLAGCGYAAWTMLHEKPATEPETAATQAKSEPAKSELAKPEPAQPETPPAPPQASPQASLQAPPQTPLEQARQFLRGNGSAADGLALSRALPQSPEGRDAAYLLLEAAAEQGQAEAMLDLAALYDPLDAHPKGSILPDAEQAWTWYGKAEKAGQTSAADRRKALRAWLEAEAGKGSATARDILSRIK